jgi:hypothetical protein
MERCVLWLCATIFLGCGSATNGTDACGGSLASSCDVPNDNGVHTCYDVVSTDGTALQQQKTNCASAATGGTVLPGCCSHAGAIARCVFVPTVGGTSTEWFLSGPVANAQSACSGKNGAFTAL